jgi:hypothetical protein
MTSSYAAGDMFERGKTFYNGGTIDSNDYGGIAMEGQIRVFPNRDPANKQVRRGGQSVTCQCVRNVSGVNLLPKMTVRWKAGYRGRRVDGYAGATTAAAGEVAGIVDEFLPGGAFSNTTNTYGVVPGDLFWIVIEGPTLCRQTFSGGAMSDISEGQVLCAVSAAGSTASTTAGRVEGALYTGATATLAAFIYNRIGRAMSAASTSQAGSQSGDILVDVKIV